MLFLRSWLHYTLCSGGHGCRWLEGQEKWGRLGDRRVEELLRKHNVCVFILATSRLSGRTELRLGIHSLRQQYNGRKWLEHNQTAVVYTRIHVNPHDDDIQPAGLILQYILHATHFILNELSIRIFILAREYKIYSKPFRAIEWTQDTVIFQNRLKQQNFLQRPTL